MNSVLERTQTGEVLSGDNFTGSSEYKDSFESISFTTNFSDFGLTSYLMTEWNVFSKASESDEEN